MNPTWRNLSAFILPHILYRIPFHYTSPLKTMKGAKMITIVNQNTRWSANSINGATEFLGDIDDIAAEAMLLAATLPTFGADVCCMDVLHTETSTVVFWIAPMSNSDYHFIPSCGTINANNSILEVL